MLLQLKLAHGTLPSPWEGMELRPAVWVEMRKRAAALTKSRWSPGDPTSPLLPTNPAFLLWRSRCRSQNGEWQRESRITGPLQFGLLLVRPATPEPASRFSFGN